MLEQSLIGRVRELRAEARMAVRRRAHALQIDSEMLFEYPRVAYLVGDEELIDTIEVWLWAAEILSRNC